jgi:4-amino-4-deoxy-L-arabinose transferase-like glycosyltransferase
LGVRWADGDRLTRFRRYVATGLLLLALVLRVSAVQHSSYRPTSDASSYLSLAGQVAHIGDYWASAPGAGGSSGPTAYFPPGYPYLLAAVDRIDGQGSLRPGAVHDARLVQALLGTITVGLTGLIALELFGPTTALIAIGMAAVYPVLIELSTVLVAENLLVVFELAAVYAALRARRAHDSTGWVVASGVFTGLAALTNANGILLLLPMLFAVRGTHPILGRQGLAGPGLLAGAAVLAVVPWLIRDAAVMHTFVPISDEAGITLAGTYNPTSASQTNPPYRALNYASVPSLRPIARKASTLSETQLDAKLENSALTYIVDHPQSPLVVGFDNTLRLLELEGSRAWRSSAHSIGIQGGAAELGVVSFWILCLLALAGLFTRAIRTAPRWLWCVPLVMWLSVALVNAGTPRFREPLEPFLILCAACALTVAWREFSSRAISWRSASRA